MTWKAQAATILLLLPWSAAAQERPKPEQPLQELVFTEVVYPQSRHELQITVGSFVDRTSEDKSALAPLSIEFGLTDRLQIQAELDGYSEFRTVPHPRASKFGIGAKYSLINIRGWPLHAALGLDVEFPRQNVLPEGEGETNTEFEPFVALAVDLRGGVAVFGSGGLSLEAGDVKNLRDLIEAPDDRGTLSVGALIRRGPVTLAGEYTSRSDQAPWRLNGSPLVTPSIAVHPGRDWELGLGLPIGTRAGSHKPGLAFRIVKELGGT